MTQTVMEHLMSGKVQLSGETLTVTIMLAVSSGRPSSVVVLPVPPATREARVNEPSIAGSPAAAVRARSRSSSSKNRAK